MAIIYNDEFTGQLCLGGTHNAIEKSMGGGRTQAALKVKTNGKSLKNINRLRGKKGLISPSDNCVFRDNANSVRS